MVVVGLGWYLGFIGSMWDLGIFEFKILVLVIESFEILRSILTERYRGIVLSFFVGKENVTDVIWLEL